MDVSYNHALFGVGTAMATYAADFPLLPEGFQWTSDSLIIWGPVSWYGWWKNYIIYPFGGNQIIQIHGDFQGFHRDFPYYNALIWVGNFSWSPYCRFLHFAFFLGSSVKIDGTWERVEFEDEDSTHNDTLEKHIYSRYTRDVKNTRLVPPCFWRALIEFVRTKNWNLSVCHQSQKAPRNAPGFIFLPPKKVWIYSPPFAL